MGDKAWRSPAFLGLFGDPYLRNTPYEFGGNPQALVATLAALHHVLGANDDAEEDHAMAFPLTSVQEAFVRETLLPKLQECRVWTEKGMQVNDAKALQAFLTEWKAFVSALPEKQVVMLPGGYVGNVRSHTMIYLIEKTDADHYSFTVCNKGPGAELYHPSIIRDETATDSSDMQDHDISSSCDKIRVQPYVQISSIPASRFLDLAFWSLLFSLWMRKPPSEYHRFETIYDVLLPWLAGDKLLPLAIEDTSQTASDWINHPSIQSGRTPQRSDLGFCKSVLEAIRYLCLVKGGFSVDEVKFSIFYQLRYRMFLRVVRGLEIAKDPSKGVPKDALEKAMQALSTVSLVDSLQGSHTLASVPSDAVVCLYFAKAGHAGCQQLTKALTQLTETLRARQKRVVVIVLSVDAEADQFSKLTADLPVESWLIVPFPEVEARKQLVQAFDVKSVPTLIVRDVQGNVLTPKGKELVESDPTGTSFPWSEGGYSLPTDTISYSERLCIQMSVKQIGLKTLKHHRESYVSTVSLGHVNKLMERVEVLVGELETASASASEKESASFLGKFPFLVHSNMELLQANGREDHYAGTAADVDIPVLGSFLDVPERVSSIHLAVGAFVRCRNLCETLLRRAADGSSSSRVSLHHEVIQLITSLLVEVLPVPKPSGERDSCIWRQEVTKEMQLKCLNHIYSALMMLGGVWQSMEQPSRQFDSERALAALCGLAIFDALLRTPASDEPLEISKMMEQEGGYVLAHRFCKANFSLRKMTASMEFARPSFCITRGCVLAYFDYQDSISKHQLFDYHMPEDKIEVKKYSTTILFFRRLMETYNYQLIDLNDPNPPTEMEALMEWFCGDESPMAKDHPEVSLARDLVMIVKFLATMETKEVELMRRRTGVNQWQMWQLSFDDSASTHRRNFFGMRGLDRIMNGVLKWEVVNFRGSDQDIADVEVVGFMERKVYFGEGPVVMSPTDLGAVLGSDAKSADAARGLPSVVTEDDIMHLDYLPTFKGTLSSEESEYLMSYLTVPYARIPLIASFFASRDRVTYLFNPMLQNLFRAVLFESGDWVSDAKSEEITHIPLRKSSLLLREEAVERVFDARVQHQKCEDHLGTSNGLLLNELVHAPEAVIQPLLKMLESIKELGEASVHSADARFILFMIKVGMDVLRYATFAVDWYAASDKTKASILESFREKLTEYAFGFAHKTLKKWLAEAESSNNLQTACVIHSYLVLLYVGLRPAEYTPERVASMIGSIAYVRNWHCFGMKVSAESSDKSGLTAEDRLLRWLQAQGIKTDNVSKSSLEKYLKGRPLYLKIGMQTIQAPSIISLRGVEGEELKLPPGEVLEVEVFETLQIHRRPVVKWLGGLANGSLASVLGEIVRIALRSTEPDTTWSWREDDGVQNQGRFSCVKTELKLDIQTGEILWRNDELKPVPDSMTQYGDFKHIFGNKSLHCGLVLRQEHRLWVKIVGTDYELVEWDDPADSIDQGVGAPRVYKEDIPIAAPAEEELKMYWECPACTCANFNGDNPAATCEVCGTPRFERPTAPTTSQPAPEPSMDGFEYMGETFSRPLDIYSDKDHPHPDEQWFVDLVGSTLGLLYPPEPEDKKLQFDIYLPKHPLRSDAQEVRLIGHDKGPKDKRDREKIDTFKEIVVLRAQSVVHIYALVSHGRRMYRKLLFASNSRLSHHGFPLNINPDAGPVDPLLLCAGGDPRERQSVGGSLVVLRRNRLLGGTEQYVPPRLLQGVVPSSLLEAFRFWMGEDGSLRGDPIDDKSQWFRYRVQVDMLGDGRATITRKSIKTSFSQIVQMGKVSSSAVVSQTRPPPVPTAAGREVVSLGERAPEVRDEDVVQLMAMGFSYAACGLALRVNSGNVGIAAQWLLDEANQVKIAEAESAADAGAVVMSEDEIHEQNIGILMSLESLPSRVVVEYALEIFDRDVDLARAWLEDPVNRDEITRVESSSRASKAATEENLPVPMEIDEESKTDGDTVEIVEEIVGDELVLFNLLGATSTDANVLGMINLLGRVEDLSHILVWCKCEQEDANIPALASFEYVELPRLKIKLKPREDTSSRKIRFDVVDQNGWLLSDISTAAANTDAKYLSALLSIVPNAWLLESDTNDLRLICPNHDIYRPRVQEEPLSNLVLADRASTGWQQAMETRFYAYPIHSSRTFLLPPSLSSTLYLILTSLLSKNYDIAMEFIKGCNIDVKFTEEEKWIFDQLVKTLDDRHPNACACRIRLSLGIVYSENKAPWKLPAELQDYFSARTHVDATCRLTVEEEREALTHCHQRSPLLSLRKTVCDHMDSNEPVMSFKLTRQRVGGQPWTKLRLLGQDYLNEHGKKVSTVRYNRPKHSVGVGNTFLLDEEESGKLVWNCAIVGDEVSGTNRGLGFMFLFECLNRQVGIRLGGEDCTQSFGDLHTRFLHLKLSRWGRETVEEGEEEYSPSSALAHLAVMIAHPYDQWSYTPTDSESNRMLSFGANLYSKMTFGSLVKSFFEFSEAEFQSKLASSDHQERVVVPLKIQFSRAHQSAEQTVVIRPLARERSDVVLEPSNAACAVRSFSLSSLAINPEFPLEAMDVKEYITFCDPEALLNASLPFDLDTHPAAQTVAAKDLLKRLADDVKANADAVNGSKDAFVTGVTPREVLGSIVDPFAVKKLEQLVGACEQQRMADRRTVDTCIRAIEETANDVTPPTDESQRSALARFLVERRIGELPSVRFDFLTALLSSDKFEDDLRVRNPFVNASLPDLGERVLGVLFLCSRIVHISRTIQLTKALISRLKEMSVAEDKQSSSKQSLQASKDLADALLAKRHYLRHQSNEASSKWNFDPRFLVFEYVFDILLRGRQVQMIESFMHSLNHDKSRVQQMIMGAGKTTVVGPLLTYILADKQHLVTHVMPTALLEQSRQVLRGRFSNSVLRKRIFTFEFDRSIADDPNHAIKLFEKLNRARLHGDVVCSSPESIKSMMLKLVELLHSLEESSDVIQLPISKSSQNVRRIRQILEDRSEMADGLYKTIRLWQDGVLIMDEVDVLLHPLRSELNFPIGNKFPIDLAANRWELPIHLIDAVLADPSHPVFIENEAVKKLHDVLGEGYATHALQRFPHLVLLDMEFYETKMLPFISQLAIDWLLKHFRMGKMEVSLDAIRHYLECSRQELHTSASIRDEIEGGLSDSSIKLLNLARDWIRTILPHVLSKINRVSYGLLRGEYQVAAESGSSGGNSQSRLLLAVPFVGKDVPSRSSEFAHPDVLIGLTILAYRYEGIRVSDLVRIVSQLKQDFSRQLGPRDQRPACALFRGWVTTGLEKALRESKSGSNVGGGVLPLPLFQLRDSSQVARLHYLVSKLAGVVYYYVRQHVFPTCMNFQKLKISACGHELGSNSLFAKRIGFSGTPSNLLPMDLGECYYEPRSDGSIFQALTNSRIVSIERKVNWTARSLLLDIARADPPFHALIDTGALITGFENHEVASFLLEHLPLTMEGVVYLDNQDRQMILLRDHNAPMPLVQCGLSPVKRFTFYDQVHTTGMDIKQCVNARAVLTLGKDMTFRDYAQGAYRMRGIETGQSIHLFMIPEVENRIRHEMALANSLGLTNSTQTLSSFLVLVPAWLLINSMRMESMQLIQLSLQELHNTWRKRALNSLMADIGQAHAQRKLKENTLPSSSRLLRFLGDSADKAWLRECIERFREEISYTVDSTVPTRKELKDVISALVAKNQSFVQTQDEIQRIEDVKLRLAHSSANQIGEDAAEHADMRLTAEVVHENEQEAEEEAEEEAEQEEQKMSAFTRDDEHPIPWSASTLLQQPAFDTQDHEDGVFYRFSSFQPHADCAPIAFPSDLLVSGNYFRRRWVGLGERRLKNIGLILEWSPTAEQEAMKKIIQLLFMKVMDETPGIAPNDAAVRALGMASEIAQQHPRDVLPALKTEASMLMDQLPVFLVAISLAEGETVRRMIHKSHPVLKTSQVRLRTCEGELVESSSFIARWADSTDLSASPKQTKLTTGIQCLRFFNNEMYYTPSELELLLSGLSNVPINLRHDFFECCLRLRRRERHLWGDTPLAKAFTQKDEWHLLGARARMQQFQQSLKRKKKLLHLATALRRFDENGDGRLSTEEVLKCFESFQLGYSSGELNEIIGLIADPLQIESAGGVLMETICAAFGISESQMEEELLREDIKLAQAGHEAVRWSCPVCTYVNDGSAETCGACNEPNPLLQDEATKNTSSQQGWQCDNCTFINLPGDVACAICELGMDGQRAVPRGKWVCAGEQGGCTFFNPVSSFYCEVCNRARPDLASTQF
ncbi:hypothetical protein Poli38472_007900 [Pythium oligandrum]|uniref:ubiquitinyl hydrolase 1 n=1 Tax=Pythium oligandrum TaxID=41045 RepID=A0A8K1CTY3_PYTOL|nr:hypothetical protein Poli38472_007900 [Pythium oligandrum]|eukprot:TMW68228.1 hypothetical protein Poli38472_007900 [Pythium oligandrum]